MTDNNYSSSCGAERINHIKCEVKNCVYHGEQDCCCAKTVEITTPCHAEDCLDTACSTFEQQV